MADNDLIKQNFHCPICLLIVEEPWETSCCGTLFCEKCKKEIKDNKCAICRKVNYTFRKNYFAKELLAKFDMKCPNGCEEKIKLNWVKPHKYECSKAVFKCSIGDCKWDGEKQKALEHLASCHSDILALVAENYKNLSKEFDKFEVIEKIMKKRDKEKCQLEVEQLNQVSKDENDKDNNKNSNDNSTKESSNGKQISSDKETRLCQSKDELMEL